MKYALTLPAALSPLLATSPGGTKTFLILIALNIAGYVTVSLVDGNNRLARHLVFGSVLLCVAGLPENWRQSIAHGLSSAQCVMAGLIAYLIFWTAWLQNPKLALLGSVVLASAVMAVFHQHAGAVHWALQSGFVFLLPHSLRWREAEHSGASTARLLVALAWVVQSFVWMNSGAGRFWMPFIPGAVVLGIYCARQIYRGQWNQFAVPAAAVLVILSGPGSATADSVRTTPVGLLAVVGSFLLFGLGTVAALTRRYWHKHEPALETESPRTTEMNR